MRSGFGGYLAVQYKQTIIDDEKVGLRVKPLSAWKKVSNADTPLTATGRKEHTLTAQCEDSVNQNTTD